MASSSSYSLIPGHQSELSVGHDDKDAGPAETQGKYWGIFICWLLGNGCLFGFNGMLTIEDYYTYLFPKYHPTRIITLTYQPFVLATTAIFTYHEARVNTRMRNLVGYMLFFLSSFGVIILKMNFKMLNFRWIDQAEEAPGHAERLSNKQLLHQNMDYALDVFLIYILTLSIFPGFLAEDTGSHSLGSWYVLVLIASFNVSDLIGRYLPLIEQIKLTSRKGLLIAVISRFLLIPAFYYTAKYGDQGWMIMLTSLLGLSNGHLTVCVLTEAPKGYKGPEQNALGNLLVLFLLAGIFIGAVSDWPETRNVNILPLAIRRNCAQFFAQSFRDPFHSILVFFIRGAIKKYHPTRVVTLTYQPFVLATTAIFTYHEAKVNTRLRNLAGYTLFFLSSFAAIILDVATSGRGGIAPFVGICIIAAVFGVADGHVQGGMTGDLSLMCPEFIQFYRSKAASEGSLTVAADLAAVGIQNRPNSMSEENPGYIERLSTKQLLLQNMDYALDMFLIYILTLSIFPGFLAEDTGSHSLGSWYALVLIASYNVWDLIGRYIPLIEQVKLRSRKGLLVAVVSRLLLIPAFYYTAKYGDQGWMIMITSFLGLSNGYLTVCILTEAPKGYKDYHPTRVLTLAYQPFAFGITLIMTYYEAKMNTRRRNLAGFSLFFLGSLALIVLDVATKGRGGIGVFIGVCIISAIFGIADANCQGALVGDLSLMCPEFVQSFMAGLAASGVITSALRLITKAAFESSKDGLRIGAILFFSITCLFELVCLLLYTFVFAKLPIVKYYRSKAAAEGSKTVASDLAAAGVVAEQQAQVCVPLLQIPNNYAFPCGFAIQMLMYALVLIAMYNVWDLIGRYVPLIPCLMLTSRKGTMAAILARFLFIPAFYFTANYGDQGYMIFLTSLLGLTNGYLTVCVLMEAPKGYKGPEQNALGNVLIVFLLGGLFSGVVLDWLWLIGKGW
ncbi:hypothetical protein HU200_054631 [Digitaria exilis]|uniref:Equilibrative nucleoside transporter n=1 Tax=Digitaria exilis TaxID=1010633 RepID=A0A835AFE0_9POAL|nr:hypothetical protein HU200_054631 [Digitaria exilis]